MLDKNAVFLLGTFERFFYLFTIRYIHKDTLDTHDLSIFSDRSRTCPSPFNFACLCKKSIFSRLVFTAKNFKKLLYSASQVFGMNEFDKISSDHFRRPVPCQLDDIGADIGHHGIFIGCVNNIVKVFHQGAIAFLFLERPITGRILFSGGSSCHQPAILVAIPTRQHVGFYSRPATIRHIKLNDTIIKHTDVQTVVCFSFIVQP